MTQPNEAVVDIDPTAEAQAAYAEMEAEQIGQPIEKKKDPETPEPVEEQKETKESEPSEDANADDKEPAPAEGEQPKEKTEEEQKAEVEKSESDVIQEYAIKHGMTWGEAREDIEKTKKVLENYKTPEELARALRSTQSAYDKLKAQAQETPKQEVFQPLTEEQFKQMDAEKIQANRDAIIAQFRQRNPARSDIMTDEAILEEFADKRYSEYKVYAREESAKITQKAMEKREKVFENIKETDKRFIPDVKAILGRVSDQRIMSADFDIQIFVDKVKGERYDVDLKAHGEREYKRGKEEAKILGVKTSGGTTTVKATQTGGLNEAQKTRAVQMFPDESPEQAYESFKDVHAEDLKKNPNFVF